MTDGIGIGVTIYTLGCQAAADSVAEHDRYAPASIRFCGCCSAAGAFLRCRTTGIFLLLMHGLCMHVSIPHAFPHYVMSYHITAYVYLVVLYCPHHSMPWYERYHGPAFSAFHLFRSVRPGIYYNSTGRFLKLIYYGIELLIASD